MLSKGGLKTQATCRSGAHQAPLRNPIAAQLVKTSCRARLQGLAGVKQALPHRAFSSVRVGGKSRAKLAREVVSW